MGIISIILIIAVFLFGAGLVWAAGINPNDELHEYYDQQEKEDE